MCPLKPPALPIDAAYQMAAYQAAVAANYRPIFEAERAAILVQAKAVQNPADAERVRARAAALGNLDEVNRLIPFARRVGRQRGFQNKTLAARRDALWRAYVDEKAKSPNATDKKIAHGLWESGGLKYGASEAAILGQIAKMKSHQQLGGPTLLERAGRPVGRPKRRI